MSALVCVPVKRFFVAKRRLAGALSPVTRSQLGRELAAHTLSVVSMTGAEPLVLAADGEVAAWADGLGHRALVDAGSGLDEAAEAAARTAVDAGRSWLILHADLPLLQPADVEEVLDHLAAGREVIAPSNDGGTSALGAGRIVRFAYGPASFHRHLARLADPVVVVRPGLALDLDDISDLRAARAHRQGAWLQRYPLRP